MSELVDKLRPEFQDAEYRHAYADDCLDTMIATQIRVLREQREMTQGQLAVATGMKQPRIPLLEDAAYSNWTVNTLKRFAKAFDVALSVKFETFSKLIEDFRHLSRESLQRPTFANDPQFRTGRTESRRLPRAKYLPSRRRSRNWAINRIGQTQVSNMGIGRKPPKSAEGATGAPSSQAANELGSYIVAAAGGNR
jgi:transcriptional regulator with XRE-family HTH domain